MRPEGLRQCDTIGNRTRDFLACSAVPQPTAPPRTTKVSPVFNHNPKGSRLRGRPIKTDGGIVHKQILIHAKLQIGKRGQKQN